MKKLMIAAAVVCAAAFVHAAAYTWSGAVNVYDWNSDPGGPATGAIEFFVNGNSMGSFDFNGDGDATFSFGIDANDQISAIATVNNFADGAGTLDWSFDFSSAYIASKPGVTEAMSQMTQDAAYTFSLGGDIDFSKTAAANGYTAVPEPTSGLLLLLGMAGLALRRRRA